MSSKTAEGRGSAAPEQSERVPLSVTTRLTLLYTLATFVLLAVSIRQHHAFY